MHRTSARGARVQDGEGLAVEAAQKAVEAAEAVDAPPSRGGVRDVVHVCTPSIKIACEHLLKSPCTLPALERDRERIEEHQGGAGRAALPSIPAESASVNGRLLDTVWCRVQQAPGHPNHAHEEELSAVRDAADPVVFECPQSEHVPIFAFETEQLEAARAARLGQNSDWRKDPRSTARSIQCRRRQMTSWCISTTTTIAFIAGSSYKID